MADDRTNRTDDAIDKELFSPDVLDRRKEADKTNQKVRDILKKWNKLYTGDPESGILDLMDRATRKMMKGGSKDRQAGDRLEAAKTLSLPALNDMFLKDRPRINRYMSYDQVYELVTEMADAAETMASNIISPESFGSEGLTIDIGPEDMTNHVDRKLIQTRMDALLERFGLQEKLFDHVKDCLIYGDLFFQIVDLDKELDDLVPKEGEKSKDLQNWQDRAASARESKSSAPSPLAEGWNGLIQEGVKPRFRVTGAEQAVTTAEGFQKQVRKLVDDVFIVNRSKERTREYREMLHEARSSEPTGRRPDTNKGLLSGRENVSLRKMDCKRVAKIMAAEQCLGYYHVEFADDVEFGTRSYQSMRLSGDFQTFYGRRASDRDTAVQSSKFDFFATAVVRELAKKLDREFLKDNPEFKEIVVEILKAREFSKKRITVDFLQPSEVVHFHPGGTPYGKSMYFNSLFTTMLYLTLLMSTTMKGIVKSSDERICWVESSGLDNDPNSAVQRVIKDMEGRNISVDDFGDISSSMRLASGFKTLYIPMIDGQKPIEYDSIPAEEAQINSDYLMFLKNAMIAGTGVPQAFLGLREEVEYARTLTMQNGNFVRKVVRWQQDIARGYTELVRKLYEAVWNNDDDENTADTTLFKALFTTPATLNDRNLAETFDTTYGLIEKMSETVAGTEDENKTRELRWRLLKQRMPQLEWEFAEEQLKEMEREKKLEKLDNPEPEGGAPGDAGGSPGGF